MLEHNLNRGIRDVRLFEMGNVFELEGNQSRESRQLSIGATGSVLEAGVHGVARPYSFFDLKGALETLLESFEYKNLDFDAHAGAEHYQAGRSARAVMDGVAVARFGQLRPDIAAGRKLKQDVFLAELVLDRLFQHSLRQVRYQPASRFPAVERDFSFVFDNSTSFEQIRSAVEQLSLAELGSIVPVEIFRGDEKKGGAVPAGKFSMLLRATFQSQERTLRDDEVAVWSGKIIDSLKSLGGTLRA
jgi:phenylalanyl-tRNA synthetase beta chain